MACIDVEHLSFTYPQVSAPALADVSLSIGGGEFVLVCGASGSGKTTLLRHLKPALVPHGAREGRILLDGRPIDDLSPREQAELVAFVAQDPNAQIVCDRVWHELAFGLENLGVDPVQMRSRVAEMASYFGIGGWFHRETSELSGGQKQLLNLAAAMVVRPQVLVLDEPTAQLDPIAAADFVATVRKLNLELGTTVVMTEHRLEEVYPLADRVVVMDGGAVAASGAPREVALELHRAASPLRLALPTAARVFLGAGGSGPCPLSVREGRVWLEGRLGDHPRRDRGGEGLGVAEASGSGEGPTVGRDAPSGTVSARSAGAFGLRPRDSQSDTPPALRLRELWFCYEKSGPDVLRGASLEVPRGAVYALMGANGAGKSTLLKAACGVCRAQRGRVEVLGRDLRRYRGAELFRGCVAMLPQDPASLFVKETVRGELAEMVGDSAAVRPCEAVHPRIAVRSPAAWRRWPSSAPSTGFWSATPATSRAASASGWPWPRCCSPTLGSCCSTSPPRASTPRLSASLPGCWGRWRPAGSRCSWSPTTSSSARSMPRGSACSLTGRWWPRPARASSSWPTRFTPRRPGAWAAAWSRAP